MDILRRYWFWISTGIVALVIFGVHIFLVGSYDSDADTVVSKLEKSAKKLSRKAQKHKALPNATLIRLANQKIATLEQMRDNINKDIAKRNAPLDAFFGFGVGTVTDTFPDPVSYKESYGNEVAAFIKMLEKYPEIETGLSFNKEDNSFDPGAFELNVDLVRDGKIARKDIAASQKHFWIQKYVVEALIAATVTGVEIAPREEISDPTSIVKVEAASDGAKVNPKYDEVYYKKIYRIEKINKITIDDGLRYDINKRFRLFKIDIDCNAQLSLVPKILARLLEIEPMIVKVRDIQVVSTLGAKKSEVDNKVMNRYKEPAVNIKILLYGLDYLNPKEREIVDALTEGK